MFEYTKTAKPRKVLYFKWIQKNRGILKKRLSLLIPLFCLFNLNAQEVPSVKLGIESGFLLLSKDSENLGLFLNVEPKVKILENTFIGLRLGLTINSHLFEINSPFQYMIDERFDNAVISFSPTIDYYLDFNSFRPYLGVGLGYHLLPNPIEILRIGGAMPTENIIDGSVKKRIGWLLRGGLERGLLRIGVEYNFVPRANIEIPNDQVIGTVENNYLGLSFGVMIGGRKDLE